MARAHQRGGIGEGSIGPDTVGVRERGGKEGEDLPVAPGNGRRRTAADGKAADDGGWRGCDGGDQRYQRV
jgi:hypothetical protein